MNTKDLEINNTYYFVVTKHGKAKKGRLLGYVKHFNDTWVNFQYLSKKELVLVVDRELFDIGIGLNPDEARKLFGKLTLNENQIIYNSSEEFYKDMVSYNEISKGKPEYFNFKYLKK